ncbi:histidinol dehydrogenase [Microbacterium sediminicola]|uniref:histidinol dehydrogenase n=1 Tax=Microbacterium sediminicola TaxID=415210 RepID=UPI0031E22604
MSRAFLIRIAAWIVAALVGLLYGAAGTIGHAYFWGAVPVGLLLAMVSVAAIVLAVRVLTHDRWAALATGLGAMLATLVLSGEGPGGSVVVEASTLGLVWTAWVPLVTVLVVAWPTRVVRRPAVESAN